MKFVIDYPPGTVPWTESQAKQRDVDNQDPQVAPGLTADEIDGLRRDGVIGASNK